MYLKTISLKDFKNIKEAKIGFSSKFNCITGLNGSGKTNLLDSIYYLSMTKSSFSTRDNYTINYNSEIAYLSGDYVREDESVENIALSISRGGEKLLKRQGKTYKRLADHIGLLPVVMVSPYDTCFINESGEERRKLLNLIISQIDGEYLRSVQNYNQLLAHRNKLLKSDKPNLLLLDTLSEKMGECASYIYRCRKEFVEGLLPHIQRYYSFISDDKEEVMIEYRSDLERASFIELVRESAQKEQLFKYTVVGVHRDELLFLMNGEPIKNIGSQGQQKTFLVALKLAQYAIFRDYNKNRPILLLDDVFDKLDITRVETLLNLVSNDNFGQIFITDSNKVRIDTILSGLDNSNITIELKDGALL